MCIDTFTASDYEIHCTPIFLFFLFFMLALRCIVFLCSYTEQIGLVYLAARFDGGYAAVTRALQEVRT